MHQARLILSNAVIIWASRALLLLPQLILVPYLIGTIGEAGYGVYALIWSLLISIDYFERSLQSGVVKYGSAFLAEGRMGDVNRLVSSSFVYSLALAAVSSSGIFAAGFWSNSSHDLRFSLLVVAAFVLLIVPLTPYLGVIQACQRYYVQTIAQTLSKYVSFVLIVAWFTWVAPSVKALILILVAMLFLSRLAQVPIAYRLTPGLRNCPVLFDYRVFRLIVGFGGMTIIVALSGIANTAGIRWLMGLLVSTNFVAHLAIMVMPASLLTQLVSAMTITVMPATSAYEATGNWRVLEELLLRSMRYATVLAGAALLVAVLLATDILMLWVGDDYTFLAPYMLAILASVAFLMTTSSAHHMLKGLGKLRVMVWTTIAGKVLIPLALILGTYLRCHNPYLAVTAGLVAGNIVLAVVQLCFSLKAVHANLGSALLRVYGQPLLALMAVAGPLLFPLFFGDSVETPLPRVALAALAPTTFLASVYFLFATPAERRQARQIIHYLRRLFGSAARNCTSDHRT